ncbi:MAG: 50S ribosome-binding GTPase [Phycisphaeraceae bacterium]|nr:50S ribosome-binding GTPase [Phycisphaeraceae bacterium]
MSNTTHPPKPHDDVSLQVLQPVRKENVIALIGNPNAGKTTLFNRLTGLRAKTGNFPGITVEKTEGSMDLPDGHRVNIVDLPGLYSISGATDEERVSRDAILGYSPGMAKPSAVVVIIDATNLERNLFLISQVIELKVPTIAVLNMIDLARRDGLKIDADQLASELGCPVVPVSARTGEGVEQFKQVLNLSIHQKKSLRQSRNCFIALAQAVHARLRDVTTGQSKSPRNALSPRVWLSDAGPTALIASLHIPLLGWLDSLPSWWACFI